MANRFMESAAKLMAGGAKPSRHRPREAVPLVATRGALLATASVSTIATVALLATGMLVLDLRVGTSSDIMLARRMTTYAPSLATASPAELAAIGVLDIRRLQIFVQALEPTMPPDDGSWLTNMDGKKAGPLIDPDRRMAFVQLINDIISRPQPQHKPALDTLLLASEFMRNNENINILRTTMTWKPSMRTWPAHQNAEHLGDTVEALAQLTDRQAIITLDEKARPSHN